MPDNTTVSATQILDLVYGDDYSYLPSQLERGLKSLLGVNADLLPTAHRLLTTGPDVAQEMVRSSLSDCIDDAVYMLDYDGGENYEPDPDTVFQLRQVWSCGVVMNEIGMDTEQQRNTIVQDLSIVGIGESHDLFGHEWYWRGVAALTLTDMWINEGSIDQELDFIEYAGKHREIGTVIAVAKERHTTNIKTIDSVVCQTANTPMLRSGSL